MTMKQPRLPGTFGQLDKDDEECTVAVQALCRGRLDTSVMAVARAAARTGREHVAIRYGRVLLYVEDAAALAALVSVVEKAATLGARVFGEPDDALAEVERSSRRHFERTGRFPKADQD